MEVGDGDVGMDVTVGFSGLDQSGQGRIGPVEGVGLDAPVPRVSAAALTAE
ncbi:hypothetical protein GCM10023086_47230 [Streptomyces venetus]|uniref:Uncharacterized protein n=1 Tax=Streptomyces venetus TaxID=1701086 RepID=A0ABP8GD50_9ACTN